MAELNKYGYIVKLSENALISLILNGLEAYSVYHMNIENKQKKVRLETFGNLFGYEVNLADGQKVYQIEIVNTDTSVKQSTGSVDYNRAAIALKIDTVSSFWPHLEYLGEFHSHPYKDYKKARETKGYYLSKGDRNDLSENSEFWSNCNHRIGLLLTIGPMKKTGSRDAQWIDANKNCVELNLGNYKLWITAYCSYNDKDNMLYTEDNDPLVILDCSALTGLHWEHTVYGRFKVEGRKVEHITANSKGK